MFNIVMALVIITFALLIWFLTRRPPRIRNREGEPTPGQAQRVFPNTERTD